MKTGSKATAWNAAASGQVACARRLMRQAFAGFGLFMACTDSGLPSNLGGSGGRGSGGAMGSGAGGAGGNGATTITTSTGGQPNGAGGDGGQGGQAPDLPCYNWPGWLKWDDFDGGYWCWSPDPETQVDPIEWEPCDPLSGFSSGCRQMKVTWPHTNPPMPATITVSKSTEGTLMVDYQRNSFVGTNPYRMWVIADIDGPVRMAFLDPRKLLTNWVNINSISGHGLAGNHYAGTITHIEPKHPEAIIGGRWDERRPTLLHVYENSGGHGVAASDFFWGTWNSGRIDIASFGAPPETVWDVATQGGYQQTWLVPFEDFATWSNSDAVYSTIAAWNPQGGAYSFIDFGSDSTQGADLLGTDGSDMVWVYSEGKESGMSFYPIRHIMTSPFAKDPSQLAPRRLRSFPTQYPGAHPFAVGCGYAAHGYEPGKVIIVRISDGWWWQLPPTPCTGVDGYCFEETYAITCDELFVRGGKTLTPTLARIELSALGDPSPPD